MSISLLSTKFYIPPVRAEGVSRPRLTEKLLAGAKQAGSFVLLSGPAGFGKTTLLSEFAAQLQHPAAWLSLDEGDNDPIRFWTYLIAACQTVRAGLGETALALLPTPQPLPDETVPGILINDLAQLNSDLVLVLDDYHTIQNQAIHAAFSFLLEHLPAKLHIVISTRVDPPWPLARFRARNQLVELRANDLRFTSEEAAAFLNQMMGLNLSTGDVAALEERTEGWVAGLQLAALSMKGRSDVTGFVKAFTGSHVYIAEYLVEEVLQRQPADVQAFLLQSSILERLNAKLCEAVTGCEDGQQMLVALYRMNLFVVALDDDSQWFRYHHLFADLLKARLRQSQPARDLARLHQRAAAWYEQAGMIPAAVEHALAGSDYSQAAQLLEKIALPMILQAHVRTVDAWLQSIPPEFVERSPRLTMAFAWMHLLPGSFAQAQPYLERLQSQFSTSEAASADPALLGEWLAIQSKLLLVQGKPAESRDQANRALQILPEENVHVRSMLLVNLASAYEQMFDYEHAAQTFQLVVRGAQASGDYVSETLATSGQAQMVLQQGRLHQGFEIASEGIRRLESSGRSTPFSATLYGEIGQTYYHWHQLDQAQRYFVRSIDASGQSGYSDPEIYYYVMLSRMYQMDGDWEAADREMQKATDLMRQIPPAMVREEIVSQQVRVDLAMGRLAAAQEILKAEGFSFDGEFRYPEPGAHVTHTAGLLYNSALRLLLFLPRLKQNLANLARGLDLAGQVLAGELQCQHVPSAIETLLVRSQIYTALRDDRSSLADVAKAVELAEPEGFISVFVEDGPPAARAITALLKRSLPDTAQPEPVRARMAEILAAFPKHQLPAPGRAEPPAARTASEPPVSEEILDLVEPLTPRELEVMRLIADGDSNQSIAEKLTISLSAVKKHTSNIFGKLNVNSRTQAVARARQLRLLAAEG